MKPLSILIILMLSFSVHSEASKNESMKKDYEKWMKDNPVGTTVDWASGKLTRTENGARFTDSLGMVTVLPEKNPDFNFIAKDNPNIAKQWADQYGFKIEKPKPQEAGKSNATQVANSKSNSTSNSNSKKDNLDFLSKLKAGSVDMLIEASKKYKSGSLSKEKYIEISLQVAQVAEYEKNTKGAAVNSGDAVDPNKWFEVNQAILPQMRKDFQSYIDSTKPGDAMDFAGGKLFRRNGGALFVGPDGDSYFIAENSPSGAIDFNGIALRNSSIAAAWKSQYGFQPVGETSYQNQRGFSSDSFTKNIEGSSWYQKPYGITIQKWITENYNSLKPGGSKTWNDLTIVRSGNPYCLMILSKDGSKHTSLCMSDDYDHNLPNDPFGTEIARKYWGY